LTITVTPLRAVKVRAVDGFFGSNGGIDDLLVERVDTGQAGCTKEHEGDARRLPKGPAGSPLGITWRRS
jgi:hypothetical protein